MSSKTSDGYVWTPKRGTRKGGLACKGVITPAKAIKSSEQHIYDAIIVGAGYAGLAVARDLATGNRSVLLLEARDRVGGRTYSVESDGGTYEMGGTWVTHFMPYLFNEMARYKMDRDMITTRQSGHEHDYYTINVPGAVPRKLSHAEAGAMTARAWNMFVNVDGVNGRKICPLPHAQLNNMMVSREEVEKWDKYSCWDRYQEVKHELSAEESGLLMSVLLHISGGTMKNSSLWDMIRSHALISHSSENFEEVWTLYKLREGQSTLARHIFEEAVECGLEYAFSTPIDSIEDKSRDALGLVEIATKDGRVFRGRRAISTIPLNVLHDIKFNPPLSPKRQEAIGIGHVNFMTKIHSEVKGSGLASWNGMRFPGLLMYGYGDGVLPNGNAHLVGFGKDERDTFVPERDPEKVVDAFEKLHPMEVQKTVFHNWNTDPYSQGGPAWWPPQFMTKYQDELQSRHGNVFFASGDWAHGWRASIDGALEQGTMTAQEAVRELRQVSRNQHGKSKL